MTHTVDDYEARHALFDKLCVTIMIAFSLPLMFLIKST